jgi:hypothetical protein
VVARGPFEGAADIKKAVNPLFYKWNPALLLKSAEHSYGLSSSTIEETLYHFVAVELHSRGIIPFFKSG